jgi:purine-nucleoside phosphorylase
LRKTSEQVAESVAAVRARTGLATDVGIILGTGLTQLADHVTDPVVIPYHDIPHFPRPTVESHHGRLVLGRLAGKPVVVMQGRFHYYEGYDLGTITHPVRVIKALGASSLFVSNAAGGVNPQYRTGDIVVITDHINLTGLNPLIGPNEDELGPRFPHMCNCYDPGLVELALATALKLAIPLQRGIYSWVTGPSLETGAEYRYMRLIGSDVIGMSTVPEVIVARHSGLRSLGFSVVTDMGLPDAMAPVDLNDVLRAAAEAEPKLTRLILGILEQV